MVKKSNGQIPTLLEKVPHTIPRLLDIRATQTGGVGTIEKQFLKAGMRTLSGCVAKGIKYRVDGEKQRQLKKSG